MSDAPSQPVPGRLIALDRDVVAATGPEAEAFLQGQLSQDVVGLADGGFAWSWLLAPNGKVDALLRVTRLSGEGWLLDTDAGWGEAVLARLSRFKLRTKVDLAPSAHTVLGLRGSGWGASSGHLPAPGVVLAPPWPGVEGADVLCEDLPAGLDIEAAGAYEADRIVAGIPRMGAELDERTIPAETGLVAMTVSFSKGCFTGQELVARIDSRGSNVPRHLRGLRFHAGASALVAPGSELLGPDGRSAGTVTSAARSAGTGWVGLGYVKRSVDLSETLFAGPGGPEVTQVGLDGRP